MQPAYPGFVLLSTGDMGVAIERRIGWWSGFRGGRGGCVRRGGPSGTVGTSGVPGLPSWLCLRCPKGVRACLSCSPWDCGQRDTVLFSIFSIPKEW